MSETFATSRMVQARTEHKCEECFRRIEYREMYERSAGKWEGSFWSLKACAHCAAFRTIIERVDNNFWEGAYGGIHAWVENTGTSPAELCYYFRGLVPYSLLTLYRWSRWFEDRWLDRNGDLRELPAVQIWDGGDHGKD